MMTTTNEYLDFALELAKAAQAQIMPYYQRSTVTLKADGSEVTEADRKAETVMRDMISEQYPTHAILGEEFGNTTVLAAKNQWIIDPLDGTSWFALGMPLFGVLVALMENNEPTLGVIHFPVLGETVYAARGFGCWYKRGLEEPIRVQVNGDGPRLKDAIISASGVHGSDITLGAGRDIHNLSSVIRTAKKFRFCGDCMQHALVCRGTLHAAIDTIMQPWDVAALIPCIEEAGGIATTLDGKHEGIVFGGSLLTSCNQALHDEIVDMLRS